MTKCVVCARKNDGSKKNKIGYLLFPFPKDPAKKARWTEIISKCIIQDTDFAVNEQTMMCSDHFLPEDIQTTPNGRHRLSAEALPVPFLHPTVPPEESQISIDTQEDILEQKLKLETTNMADNTDIQNNEEVDNIQELDNLEENSQEDLENIQMEESPAETNIDLAKYVVLTDLGTIINEDATEKLLVETDVKMEVEITLEDESTEAVDIIKDEFVAEPEEFHKPVVNMKGAEKKTSRAWEFFTVMKGSSHRAKCNFCGKVISYKGGGPYNLIRHTKSQHPSLLTYEQEINPCTSTTSSIESDSMHAPRYNVPNKNSRLPVTSESIPSSSVVTRQSLPAMSFTNQHKNLPKSTARPPKPALPGLTDQKAEYIDRMLVKLFAKNYLSFSLVDTPEFREFVKELNPDYELPSHEGLISMMERYYVVVRKIVKDELSEAEKIALTTEGWSQNLNDKYIGVTAHFINKEAEPKAYNLECIKYSDQHTAENLALQLRKTCEDWGIKEKVVAVTTDDAKNVKDAVGLNGWKQVSCFTHSLNYTVLNAMPEIKYVHLKVIKIAKLFKRNSQACERLKSMQEKLGESLLKVEQQAAACWNSTCNMFKRILEIKKSLLKTLAEDYSEVPSLTSEDIVVLQKSTEILRNFQDVTNEMCSGRPVTISEMVYITTVLKNKCLNYANIDELPISVRNFSRKLHNELHTRFSPLESDNILLESTILDPRFIKLGFHDDSVCDRALSSLKTSALSDMEDQSDFTRPPPEEGSIWYAFDVAMIEEIKQNTPLVQVEREIKWFLKEPLLPRLQDRYKWWLDKKVHYPRLYSVATQRLCIQATSVPPETIFENEGRIIMKRRNLLSGKKLSRLVFLDKNI